MHYFLGQEVWQRTDEIFLSQGKHTVGILKKFSMTEWKTTVMNLKKMNDDDSENIDPQLIRSLMYLVNTRPDSCYELNVLSQSMSQPRQTHWIAVKHVLRYIRGTVGYGLRYASSVNLSLQGYADTDWAESTMDRKSTSSCCFTMKVAMVSWYNRKQSSVALSTTKAEYIASNVWSHMTSQASDRFTWPWDGSYDDNQESCVKLLENPVFPDGLKHDEKKYLYIIDMM